MSVSSTNFHFNSITQFTDEVVHLWKQFPINCALPIDLNPFHLLHQEQDTSSLLGLQGNAVARRQPRAKTYLTSTGVNEWDFRESNRNAAEKAVFRSFNQVNIKNPFLETTLITKTGHSSYGSRIHIMRYTVCTMHLGMLVCMYTI